MIFTADGPESLVWVKGDLPPATSEKNGSVVLVWTVYDCTGFGKSWVDRDGNRVEPEELNGKFKRVASMVAKTYHHMADENITAWVEFGTKNPLAPWEKVVWYAWLIR